MNIKGKFVAGLLLAALVLLVICVASMAESDNNAASATEGLYLSIAPDLVINTATAKVIDSKGAVIVPASDTAGETIGKYHGSGYVTTITDSISTTGLGIQTVNARLVKAVSVIDTTTGRYLVKSRVYYNQSLGANDLR